MGGEIRPIVKAGEAERGGVEKELLMVRSLSLVALQVGGRWMKGQNGKMKNISLGHEGRLISVAVTEESFFTIFLIFPFPGLFGGLIIVHKRYFHQVLQPSGSVFPTLSTTAQAKSFRKFCNSYSRSPPRQSDTVETNSHRTTGAHRTSLGSSPEPPEQRRSSTAHVDGDPHRLKATQPPHAVLQLHCMMDHEEYVDLPFKVGQMAESRSFLQGFRGAWFRCKIKEIGSRKGLMGHALEFVDFPDEKTKWTQLYQKRRNWKEVKRQLMVRPQFPPIFRESQMPDVNSILEVVVIVDNVWKVGDLVDWLMDSCYWSGRVTELLGDEKVKKQTGGDLPEVFWSGFVLSLSIFCV
ncbi:uncharacterized protein LOC132178268 [Corylus avellana]|uniref:uncharacterized protein LOC132178268 n=1 Tax=Corylus avellana TaxID=13451 RepID=UPI00286BD6C7|nr:uncharacterized protein LOC132178268 [Corylus avellana]